MNGLLIGIDDTDTADSPGTNQLARAIARQLRAELGPAVIVRHQLLFDPRIPYTSKNGSASIRFSGLSHVDDNHVIATARQVMRAHFIEGSDPGLCVTRRVPDAVVEYGVRCQQEIMTQETARRVAAETGLFLEGLGGTQGGVIGALAAVGLAERRRDGRVIQIEDWTDDLTGPQDVAALRERGISVRCQSSGEELRDGRVDIGKRLRPNVREGAIVLLVERLAADAATEWQAQKLL